MKKIFKDLLEYAAKADAYLLDLLYPPRCAICDKAILRGGGICAGCRKKLQPVAEPACMKCGKPLAGAREEYCSDCKGKHHQFVQGKSLWIYEKDVKASLYRFKYRNRREYAAAYAKETAARYGGWIKSKGIQAIVPIPLYRGRQRQRGYNQAGLFAKELGKILGIPADGGLLIRVRDTKPQKALNEAERKNNLKNAFKTAKNIVQLECVLVVDDIYTTGATLDAAAAALRDAGIRNIYACSIGTGRDD